MAAETLREAIISSAAFSGVMGFALNGIWGRKFAIRDAKATETIKNDLLRELEKAKHLLQLEQAKLSIVYEHQRTSFSNVIKAMDVAIATLDASFDWGAEEFTAISESDLEVFQRARSTESLYTGSEGDEILGLFEAVLSETVGDRDNNGWISDAELRWSRKQLKFVFTCAQDYFRYRIGLATDDQTLDVAIVAACRLLNRGNIAKAELVAFPEFQWSNYSTFIELVLVCRQELTQLCKALERFEENLESRKERRGFLFEYLEESRRIRARLSRPLASSK